MYLGIVAGWFWEMIKVTEIYRRTRLHDKSLLHLMKIHL